MENTFWTALGASSLAALVTTIGIYVVRHFERWGRKNTVYFICFAAGVLISVSFLHLIPKAFSMNTNAPIYLFLGYLSLHLFNRFINAFVCDKAPDELHEKRGWGHSSWEQAVEVAEQAEVRRLALFHHDPEHNDSFLLNMEKECQKRFPDSFIAREGTAIKL